MRSGEGCLKGFDMSMYILRKIGFKNGIPFFISAILPAFLILLVSLLLVFSLSFITSMVSAMEDVMANLGSGHVTVDGLQDLDGPGFYSVDKVVTSEALAFSGKASAALYVKGVDFDSYFNPKRLDVLNFSSLGDLNVLNPVYLSSSLSKELGVDVGDRLSILIYESSTNRTRPLLLTCAGVFSSGYNEFDSVLCYVDRNLVEDGDKRTEVLLGDESSIDEVIGDLTLSGYTARSYKSVYSDLYSNVEFSLTILYGIFFILALLAAVFSSNIAFDYVSRDRKDIANLMVLGLGKKDVARIYLVITLSFVFVALLVGLIFGIALSFLIPGMMEALGRLDFAALDAYMTSFDVSIPLGKILLMLGGLFFSSCLSLLISLRKTISLDIHEIIAGA